MTLTQIKRLSTDWTYIAQEIITVEYLKGFVFGYGTELGTLRIFKKYNLCVKNKKIIHDYCKNLKTWFISLELNY
jgi:hypothetical protein